jgi:hypothetical protein
VANFQGGVWDGVEVGSTASILHLEKILFEKVESPGKDKVAVWPFPPC